MTKEPLTHSVNALEQGLSTGGPQAVSGPLNCKTQLDSKIVRIKEKILRGPHY